MSRQITVRSKPPMFSFGLVLVGVFLVVVHSITHTVPIWALLVAVFGSLAFDRLTSASPKSGVYIE